MRIWKLLVGVALLAISQPASAVPLNPILIGDPDISVTAITVDYDAGTNQFSATGFPTNLHLVSSDHTIIPGLFDLNAEIDEAGALVGGLVTISGEVLGTGHNGTLLTGIATAFGFDEANTKPSYVDFLFNATRGSLFLDGTFSSQFAITLTSTNASALPDTPNSGAIFENDFSFGAFQAVADVGSPIPEPNSTILMGFGLAMLTLYGRRKYQRPRQV